MNSSLNHIILWWKSVKNKEWVIEVVNIVSNQLQLLVEGWHFKHWLENIEFDFQWEKQRLLDKLRSFENDYVVICKSVGAVLTLAVLEELEHKPIAIYVFGLPKDQIKNCEQQLNNINKIYKGKLYIYQNSNDPAWSKNEITTMFPNLAIQELIWDTHDYDINNVVSSLKE